MPLSISSIRNQLLRLNYSLTGHTTNNTREMSSNIYNVREPIYINALFLKQDSVMGYICRQSYLNRERNTQAAKGIFMFQCVSKWVD